MSVTYFFVFRHLHECWKLLSSAHQFEHLTQCSKTGLFRKLTGINYSVHRIEILQHRKKIIRLQNDLQKSDSFLHQPLVCYSRWKSINIKNTYWWILTCNSSETVTSSNMQFSDKFSSSIKLFSCEKSRHLIEYFFRSSTNDTQRQREECAKSWLCLNV